MSRLLEHLVALALAASLPACAPALKMVERGTVVAHQDLEAQRTDLRAMVSAALQRGETARAFYILEVEKSRQFAGLTRTTPEAQAAPPVNPIEGVEVHRGAAVEGSRGLQLEVTVSPKLKSNDEARERAFWQEQKELSTLLGSIQSRGMPYGMTLQDRFVVMTAEEVTRAVTLDQVLLSYFVGADAVYVFAARRSGMRVARLALPPSELEAKVGALVRSARRVGDESWSGQAQELYQALLGPVESSLAGVKTITIVPHGFLSNLPFVLLRGGNPQKLLLERATVSYLPSASFYRTLLERPVFSDPPRMLAVGNARYPAPWPALPEAEVEARALARLFAGSVALTREAATEERFLDLYRRYNVLHFATHGMLVGTLAADASSILLSPSFRADGYLTAAEISRLFLSRSYLAVLSACETSVSSGASSSLDSISAAFLAAGAPSVIGSQWKVSDESTARLMVDFYARFLEVGTAAALRNAQLALAAEPATRHPFFWAAFVLYGWDK